MIQLLSCEILKLKRSKMVLISCLGALATPVMVFVGVVKFRLDQPGHMTTFASFFLQSNMYTMLLFGLIVNTVIASYLFSRENTENTLKTILTVPISRILFILSKFVMLLIWMLSLSVITWISSLCLGIIVGCVNLSMDIVMNSIVQCLFGTILMYLVLLPFVYLILRVKNLVLPIICATTVAMINVAMAGESLAALFPWSSFYLLVSGDIDKTEYSPTVVLVMILVTALVGFGLSIWHFNKEDVK